MRLSGSMTIVFAVAMALTASPGFAQDPAAAEIEGVIRHHVAALNSGDVAAMSADWEESGTVVDGFAPFIWQGSAPIGKWWADLQLALKPAGLNMVTFAVDDWQRIRVTNDRAYAAAHATALISGPSAALQAKGTWTFALHRQGKTWRISSWTWGGPGSVPLERR